MLSLPAQVSQQRPNCVEGFSKSLVQELATTIRINAMPQTVTDTQLASKLLRNKDKHKRAHQKNLTYGSWQEWRKFH